MALGCARVEPVNVVLIVIDTLRRDALGVYGAERETSPALAASAAPSRPDELELLRGLGYAGEEPGARR